MARSDNRSVKIPHSWILDFVLLWTALVLASAVTLWIEHKSLEDIVRQVGALFR